MCHLNVVINMHYKYLAYFYLLSDIPIWSPYAETVFI